MSDKLRVVHYPRVSREEQARNGYGLDFQKRDLAAWSERDGDIVVEVIEEPGYSRESWDRPGLNRIRELAKAGKIDAVKAWRRDRYFGVPMYRALFEQEMARYGVKLLALDDAPGDTAVDEFQNNLKDIIAQLEVNTIRERMMAGRRERAEKGLYVPSRIPPYGFKYNPQTGQLEVNTTATHVRRIFEEVASGRTLRSTVTMLNEEGIPTPDGGRLWRTNTLRRILQNDVYLTRSYDELKGMVSSEALARLDPSRRYGVSWYGQRRAKKVYTGPTKRIVTDQDRASWVAIPVVDLWASRPRPCWRRAAGSESARLTRGGASGNFRASSSAPVGGG